jgi:hypothetical protein
LEQRHAGDEDGIQGHRTFYHIQAARIFIFTRDLFTGDLARSAQLYQL